MYNSSCKLIEDGQIDLYVNGGVGPYTIYSNSMLINDNMTGSFTMNNLPSAQYNINVIDAYGCSLDTNFVLDFEGGYECINEPIIITPNFDNYNDEWIPILDLDVEIEVNILNRWGQKEYVYIGNSLSFAWDGLGNWGGTHELPSGDYYYIIKFNNNNYTDKTGVITLIR